MQRSLLSLAAAIAALAAAPASRVERRLYVADTTGVSLYDIDRDHRLLRRIALPDSGEYKGIAASTPLGRLYITSNTRDQLIAVDLATEKEVWRRTLGSYADSPAITPDGKTLYVRSATRTAGGRSTRRAARSRPRSMWGAASSTMSIASRTSGLTTPG
jgi:sugar lactone lactonase YvrE